jgi:hypothetical protein
MSTVNSSSRRCSITRKNGSRARKWSLLSITVGVHVRVEVKGKLKQTNVAGTPYDGTVVVDTTLTFYDSGEGEVNDVVSDTGRELATGQSYEMPFHLESDDTVPERASGWVRISNIFAVLP